MWNKSGQNQKTGLTFNFVRYSLQIQNLVIYIHSHYKTSKSKWKLVWNAVIQQISLSFTNCSVNKTFSIKAWFIVGHNTVTFNFIQLSFSLCNPPQPPSHCAARTVLFFCIFTLSRDSQPPGTLTPPCTMVQFSALGKHWMQLILSAQR